MKALRITAIYALVACVIIPSALIAQKSTKTLPSKIANHPTPRTTVDRPLDAKAPFFGTSIDTFIVAEFDFDGAGGLCDAQGWYSVDVTAQLGFFFHVDDFAGTGGGETGRLAPLEGAQSLWCGVRADSTSEDVCGYATLPGYGNEWNQGFESVAIPVAGDVTLSYLISWDTESSYDFAYAEYMDVGGAWVELASYTGTGEATETWVIPGSVLPDSLRVRFRFVSDLLYSDEDGDYESDGAVIIDSVTISDSTGVVDFQDFESETVGANNTMDGNWQATEGAGYGDFASLYLGAGLLQEDPCITNPSCMWGFFEGSTYDYSCGGHPEQLAVPYENARGQYISNDIRSPWIDWTHDKDGAPIPDTASMGHMEFDIYADLPLDNLVFYVWHVRTKINGCPTTWSGDGFFTHGPDEPEWRLGWRGRVQVSVLLPPGATEVQMSVGVRDRCDVWCGFIGSGDCHSHAPLIDNVRLVRIDTPGPVWSPDGFSLEIFRTLLFQDNFAETSDYTRPGTGEFTSSGKVRIDNGWDILDRFDPGILLGDSLVIGVTAPNVGLDRDAGGGPAAYIHVKDLPGKSGAILSGGPRWPYAPSVSGGGWTAVRMDSISMRYTEEIQFCADLNDNLYEPGDSIFYYMSARDADGKTTYWTETTKTITSETAARANPMEMTCLPANALTGATDVLIVNAHDGGGVQPYFDFDFKHLGITPDRFDMYKDGFNNGLASSVKDVVQQLIPYYQKIIWSSGNRSEYIIGNGDRPRHKSDDFGLLYTFLDQHTDDCGVYFTGDDLAGEWTSGLDQPSALQFRDTFMNFTFTSGDHQAVGAPLNAMVIGQTGSCFDKPAGPDSMFAYAGCPVIRGFDVLVPTGNASLEMAYSNDPSRGAILSQETFNPDSAMARVLLSGFGYDAIRNDRIQNPHDRIVHLQTILQWLGNEVPVPTGAITQLPFVNSLAQNFPNPFNPTTTIRYSLRQKAHVSIRIYNVAGQLVRTLVDESRVPGPHVITWDGLSSAGQPVSSGVYFYRLVAGDFAETRKMVVLK